MTQQKLLTSVSVDPAALPLNITKFRPFAPPFTVMNVHTYSVEVLLVSGLFVAEIPELAQASDHWANNRTVD